LVTVDDVIEDDTCQVGSVNHSDDFEDLLDKIGHQEDVKIQVKEKTDDFFIGDGFRRAVYFKGIPTVKHSVALSSFSTLQM
jgi:hypothetical protein